ncbi:MAG: helix-turn-helix transcriptional regulator [Ruminococcus sp.]|nr:helix-turn-helix transcriptional regulator [Ruminococcus sp.]
MFADFRQNIKALLQSKGITYAQIAEQAGIEESTVKSFMCAANDSRRVAEKLADALGVKLEYSNGVYTVVKD